MSHREEFEKALADHVEAMFGGSLAEVQAVGDRLLRLYDEKPPTRSDLEAVTREAFKAALIHRHDRPTVTELAAEVVTRYLTSRS